eukprot:4749022-Prymnesium_polylepis.1
MAESLYCKITNPGPDAGLAACLCKSAEASTSIRAGIVAELAPPTLPFDALQTLHERAGGGVGARAMTHP